MKLSKIQLAVIALIITNMIWGAASPIFKWSLEEISPFTLAFLRFSIAALILLPFIRKNMKLKREDIPYIVFLSVIGLTFHIAYYFTGLRLSSSINVPIISSAAPIFLIIGSTLFLHEKIKKKVIFGMTVSLAGVVLIILRPIFETGVDNSLIGNLLFTVSMGLSVFYTLMLKEISPKYNPLTLTFWIFVISSISFIPLVIFETGGLYLNFSWDAKSMIGIGFGAVLCSVVAYSLHAFAIKYISASEVALFAYVDPVIAMLIARPLLGETITSTFLVGAVLIFFGIFLAEGRLHYHPIHLLNRKDYSNMDFKTKE